MIMKWFFVSINLILINLTAFTQCVTPNQIKPGGDYNFIKYMFLSPTYTFGYNGDTSRHWNALNNKIDINQAPSKAIAYKKSVEKAIKNYAGLSFYSNIKFIDVEINFPEKMQELIDSGRTDMKQQVSKAKYFYHYQFVVNDTAAYLIGIAVDKNGEIISPFPFPLKKYYKPVKKEISYCKLIEIAQHTDNKIEPIESISLEYNSAQREFYWSIVKKLVDTKEGWNDVYKVYINASDLSAKQIIGKVRVIF